MIHVFVETNWLVDCLAPEHRRKSDALTLLERCVRREVTIYVPALCIAEARKVLRNKFQPRDEADLIRSYIRWAAASKGLTSDERETALRILSQYESFVRTQIGGFEEAVTRLRDLPSLNVFSMEESQLELSIALSLNPGLNLQAFDQSVLAAVLGRTKVLLTEDPEREICFCERDSDLWPWDKTTGEPRKALADLYDEYRIWVYADFTMQEPCRPEGWPRTGD